MANRLRFSVISVAQEASGEMGMCFSLFPGAKGMAILSVNDVQGRAQAALTNSPFYELRELQVDPQGPALMISGTVSSFYHKQLAQEVVRSVCREVEVVNAIRVEEGGIS